MLNKVQTQKYVKEKLTSRYIINKVLKMHGEKKILKEAVRKEWAITLLIDEYR